MTREDYEMSQSLEAVGYYERGLQHQTAGKHRPATIELRLAVALAPRHAAAWIALARSLGVLGKYDDAAEAYGRACSLDGMNGHYRGLYADSCKRAGRISEAMQAFRLAINLSPGEHQYYLELAALLLRLGKKLDALGLLIRAAVIFPRVAVVKLKLGVVYEVMHVTARARECYREACEIDPSLGMAWFNLGSLFEGEGQWMRSAECFREVVCLSGYDIEARARLARVLAAAGHYEEAGLQMEIADSLEVRISAIGQAAY
jgi:tetratricopeptide (TPR) repeat protein